MVLLVFFLMSFCRNSDLSACYNAIVESFHSVPNTFFCQLEFIINNIVIMNQDMFSLSINISYVIMSLHEFFLQHVICLVQSHIKCMLIIVHSRMSAQNGKCTIKKKSNKRVLLERKEVIIQKSFYSYSIFLNMHI